MTLMCCEPNREFDRLFDRMHRSIRRDLDVHALDRSNVFSPPVDFYEDEKNVYVEVELPGLSKEDVKVSVHEGLLTIEGVRKTERGGEGANYLQFEGKFGTFSRSFDLPEEVNADNASARFENGVLRVEFPRRNIRESERVIDIK
ncbi:MAG: Hsp20/alpha crystallin family protein [Bacteroidota bacterium]